ncbi:hypothetical protein H9L19_06380 [Weissella diestrammenae]|uniref:Uncharacterized protein n=1 Tax=Weissella diestrammenae TaxID=1162633 RepID=A0A7G9T4I4_9LACO|nr:hypothetical protein [Weissella diestrammenae]MCM0582143.1 hypothetical protein [Weissella diestrammenae]QNN75009.1 hypothetical protein H9L19_06380 [Weissella diestrammenae]
MDPETNKIVAQLADITIRNTATIIHDKITASKAKKNDKETIAELTDIISELLSDKQELQRISGYFENELIAQKISDEDLTFIAETVVPTIEKLLVDSDDMMDNLNKIKPLLSRSTFNVLQMIGFNFKKGIGEPLTNLLSDAISGIKEKQNDELSTVIANRDIEYFKLLQDKDAFDRWRSIQ